MPSRKPTFLLISRWAGSGAGRSCRPGWCVSWRTRPLGACASAAGGPSSSTLSGTAEPMSEDPELNVTDTSPEQPEDAAIRAEARRLLEAKIDQLPDAFRTVFVLRAVEEMTVEEAGVCLGIPTATVRTRYFRAKGLLRESLAREIDFSMQDAFRFDGDRCDRIVAGVLNRLKDVPQV